MRTGLVLIGAGLLVVGVALAFLGSVNLPYGTTMETKEPISITLPASAESVFPVQGQNGSSSLKLDFTASQPLNVWLTSCNPRLTLPPPCILAKFAASYSGEVSLSQPQFPLFLVLSNQATTGNNVSVVIHLSSTSTNGIGLWEDIVVLAGGGILLLGGVIFVLLGLFLQGNPYADEGMPIEPEQVSEKEEGAPEDDKDTAPAKDEKPDTAASPSDKTEP
jgi:hypothetical protein